MPARAPSGAGGQYGALGRGEGVRMRTRRSPLRRWGPPAALAVLAVAVVAVIVLALRVGLIGPLFGSRSPATSPTVGALFGPDGRHFCTAAVVGDGRRSALLTAAHCVHGDEAPALGLTFVPGYRDGRRPHGTWMVTEVLLDDGWLAEADPDVDVAVLRVAERDGRDIGDVVGWNVLGVDRGRPQPVTVVGYPDDREAPRICATASIPETTTRLRFDCAGFTDGTSGGPWLAGFDPRAGTGEVIGVIGGYLAGGDTPGTSYSPRFGPAVRALWERAG